MPARSRRPRSAADALALSDALELRETAMQHIERHLAVCAEHRPFAITMTLCPVTGRRFLSVAERLDQSAVVLAQAWARAHGLDPSGLTANLAL